VGDYPHVQAGSEINSDYAVDSQTPHCNGAYGVAQAIARTRTVPHIPSDFASV